MTNSSMTRMSGRTLSKPRVGTVGYNYRDWAGLFYPQGASSRRQLALFGQHFGVCELTQFSHQMPDVERVAHFAAQVKSELKFFVRIHQAFTHTADVGMALTIAKHFRRAMEPLFDQQKLAGFVAPFPYAFKNSAENREYVAQLAHALRFDQLVFQADFRHPSWANPKTFDWMAKNGLGYVCVDEPQLPGLLPPLAVATANHVLVRLHGRNSDTWWSGNPTTRFDYTYTVEELSELMARYNPLWQNGHEVSFIFQNHWQAQSVRNALQLGALLREEYAQARAELLASRKSSPIMTSDFTDDTDSESEERARPPLSLSFAELKSRVSQVLNEPGEVAPPLEQTSMDLVPRVELEFDVQNQS